MATVNLGNIKLNWKGAYNAGTAYIVDDVVSYNGSSYVCIQASTGNLPTVTTYWNQMSAKGTDGTDLTSTLTTQGDILYRDGSGLARLAAGTAGHVLQTGGSGANPSWTAVSSDYVKLIDHDITSNVSSVNITGWIDNTTYQSYFITVSHLKMTAEDLPKWYFINNSGSAINTGTDYSYCADHIYLQSDNNFNNNLHNNSGTNGFKFVNNNAGTGYYKTFNVRITALDLNTAANTSIFFESIAREGGGQIDYGNGWGWLKTSDAFTNSSAGFALDRQGSGQFSSGNITVYGLK